METHWKSSWTFNEKTTWNFNDIPIGIHWISSWNFDEKEMEIHLESSWNSNRNFNEMQPTNRYWHHNNRTSQQVLTIFILTDIKRERYFCHLFRISIGIVWTLWFYFKIRRIEDLKSLCIFCEFFLVVRD